MQPTSTKPDESLIVDADVVDSADLYAANE